MSPDYVLADEPTAALDEENRDLLLLIMQEQMKDKGILFVSHDVAALKNLCQNVYVLGAGKIIEHGTMDKLLSSPQTDWMKQFSAREILMRFRTSTSTFVKVKVLLLREKADREKARWQDF